MKRQMSVMLLGLLTGCNVTGGSRIVVGPARPAIAEESVKIYFRPPARYEEIALLNATSKNAFASDQSLTDSVLRRMKRDAARLGANGVLLQGVGSQQIGSVGQGYFPYIFLLTSEGAVEYVNLLEGLTAGFLCDGGPLGGVVGE